MRHSVGHRLFVGTGILLIGILIIGFILRVVEKVHPGHGLEYYYSGTGIRWNYVAVLIFLAIIPVALIIGWFIRLFSKKKGNKPRLRG